MKVTRKLEFDRETVDTMTRFALADAARKVFGEPGPGEEIKVETSPWGPSSAEIVPMEQPARTEGNADPDAGSGPQTLNAKLEE